MVPSSGGLDKYGALRDVFGVEEESSSGTENATKTKDLPRIEGRGEPIPQKSILNLFSCTEIVTDTYGNGQKLSL